MEINSVRFLKDSRVVLNNAVTFCINEGKLDAKFDKNKIKENEAVELIELYLNDILEKMGK